MNLLFGVNAKDENCFDSLQQFTDFLAPVTWQIILKPLLSSLQVHLYYCQQVESICYEFISGTTFITNCPASVLENVT